MFVEKLICEGSQGFDKKSNYVKRAIGIPGDSLEIRDGLVYKTETYNKDGFLVEVLGLEENQETLLVYDDKGSLIIEGYHQIFYDDTRTLKMRGFINDGKPDGPWQTFDKDTNFLGYNFWDEGRKLEVVSFDMIHFYDETVTLRNNSEDIINLATSEGLYSHADSVRVRFED